MKVKSLFEKMEKEIGRYRPIPFWSWNDRLEPEELRRQIRAMKEVSMGGFFMHARGGLLTDYMGEEWFAAVEASMDEAQKQNMYAWCYDENGWPSGFAGMELLKDEKNWVHYLQMEHCPQFDEQALAVYVLKGKSLSRVLKPQSDVAEYLCVYDRTNSSAVDILNPEVTDAFIALTHQKYFDRYGEHFGKEMMGFFTDEPQYYRYDTAYTPVMLTAYREKYGKDLLDQLAALFVDCKGASGFRFRYWHLMNILYAENFAGRIHRWCREHNCMLTGHSFEERTLAAQMMGCAGIMPFYEYEDIPGVDALCRKIDNEMMPRQVSSVAQQLGKKQVLTETFASAGWDVTPRELKRIAEWQYVHGVNLLCHHLYPYSIRGQRKRDFPAFYSEHNPWTVCLAEFNDYFTSLGYLLAESREEADVLILHPIHSAYLTYDRSKDEASVRELTAAFRTLIERFGAAGIGHHYGDEHLMAKYGSVENGVLRIGACSYDTVVIPACQTLDSTTAELLRTYMEQGGKLWLAGEKPNMVDGETADLGFLCANTDFDSIAAEKALWIQRDTAVRATHRDMDGKHFVYAVNLSETETQQVELKLPYRGAELLNLEDQSVSPICFLSAENSISVPLTLEAGQSVILLQNDEATAAPAPGEISSVISLHGQLPLCQPVENALTLDYVAVSDDGETYSEPMPVMELSEKLLRQRKNRRIWLKYTFCADYIPADLSFETETCLDAAVMINGVSVVLTEQGKLDRSFIRGNIAKHTRCGENELVLQIDYRQSEHTYNVFNGYYYGSGEMTETMVNCLTYETNIEAAYLFGHFAVESMGGYKVGRVNSRLTEGPFVLREQWKTVDTRSVTECGFPFYSGAVRVRTTVQVDRTDWILRCKGRYQFIRVWVNGAEAKTLLLRETCDLSPYLKTGENTLELELMSSNRNLLGPHHIPGDPEPVWVGPDQLSFYGTWSEEKGFRGADPGEMYASDAEQTDETYDPAYSFMPFGLEVFQLEAPAE